VVTETWLGSVIDAAVLKDLIPTGYDIEHVPRQSSSTGGGVAVIFKLGIKVSIIESSINKAFTHFEYMDCQVTVKGEPLYLSVIYRPPPSQTNGLKNTIFFTEWTSYLERFVDKQQNVLITGDLNFHLDDEKDNDAMKFMSVLDAHSLCQHVQGATHKKGHTLDLVITHSDSTLLKGTPIISHPGLCDKHGNLSGDHFAVNCTINMQRPLLTKRSVSFRALRKIDVTDFKQDIYESEILNTQDKTLHESLESYNNLQKLLDKHAPLQEKCITLRPHAPWYTEELREAKQEKRHRERVWRKSKLEVHHQLYLEQCQTVSKLLHTTKEQYYSGKAQEYQGDQKSLHRLTKNMMGQSTEIRLPSHESPKDLAEKFNDFFISKIVTIRNGLLTKHKNINADTLSDSDQFAGIPLNTFPEASEDEVKRLIMKSPSKSCELDPLPTWLLKKNVDELTPIITTIVNLSLKDSCVPHSMKTARIRPLLKKEGLDPEIFKNYRPVSNLTFVSKILEKVVASRLENHLSSNSLMDEVQSAYRPHHSTETALVKVQADIAQALDNGLVTILIMLDLSAAFDTIDHKILLTRLEKVFGITGDALNWFKSYLLNRHQSVVIGDTVSEDRRLDFGVPQGSVLGPKAYCMYTKPVGDIIKRHGLNHHTYADDTQIYVTFKPTANSVKDAIIRLESCVEEVKSWMENNLLKLNEDKTELIVFTPKQKQHLFSDIKVTIGGCSISPKPHVKNLGVVFDKHLAMDKHVNTISRTCHYHLRNIGRIRRYLTNDACRTVVQSLVTSRLDYGNALLHGQPKTQTQRLQKIQNTAARIVACIPRHEHITPVLKNLHWLPVEARIQYRVILLTFKALHDKCPSYVTKMVELYKPKRALRSQDKSLLCTPKTKTVTYGERSFVHSAPILWNTLPLCLKEIRSIEAFKRHLKTFLFRQSYLN
jgi:hypothetical protein